MDMIMFYGLLFIFFIGGGLWIHQRVKKADKKEIDTLFNDEEE